MSARAIQEGRAMRRDQWNWPPSRQLREDGVSFTSGDNGLTIEVAEEKAMDSYNEQVEVSVTLPPDVARALVAWLLTVAETPPTETGPASP